MGTLGGWEGLELHTATCNLYHVSTLEVHIEKSEHKAVKIMENSKLIKQFSYMYTKKR